MQRRTFLRNSAIAIGTFAGMRPENAKVEGASGNLQSAPARHSSADEFLTEAQRQLTWGINAAVLGASWSGSPSLDDLLADHEHTLVLSRFYRFGGENRPATPTECRVAYNSDALFVGFRCQERDMSFPYANLDPAWWREANWYSLHGLPSAANNWPPYPDEVDLLIQPDPTIPSYCQFAATLQGSKFGCKRLLNSNTDAFADEAAAARHSTVNVSKAKEFEASVRKGANEWLVFFQLPWETLGGRPKSYLGFLPMRTRWRDGEFSSPVAIDFNEGMPVDLLIETHFPGSAVVQESQTSLCQLPSGRFRWQRPAVLAYPDVETCRQIWPMESSLCTPTNTNNLGQRLFLTQRWTDLMTLEGFTALPRAWGILKSNLTLALCRQRVNAAFEKFEKNDMEQACRLMDAYLGQLDRVSRWWYADGSPGDTLAEEWKPITSVDSLKLMGSMLQMECVAGGHRVDLHLALPKTGGARIFGNDEGYWRPANLLPINATQSSGSCSIETREGRIVIHQKPFSISLYNVAGDRVIQIGPEDVAFRFDSDGQILAVDFKNHLDPSEVIYGFGEKYDDFNENGRILTLWGTDDWVGNGEGLANTSYKPLPIFHSSKGYMVFDNSSYRLRADIGKTHPDQYRLTQQGPIFDYYFWIGSPQAALQSYTALTGRPPLPPKWVFEPWMGRGGEAWATGRLHNAVAEEESVTLRFAELDIPHSAIYAEGPSALSPELNEFMAGRGIRVLGYFYPAIRLKVQERLMPELKGSELPYLRFANGNPAPGPDYVYVDFTNPYAPELCRRALKRALDLGEAGSMVDFGDMTPDGAVFYDGQHGAEMHNFYYYDYQRTVSEVFQEKRGNDFILYARGAAPGTQRWVGQFAGDHPANFVGIRHVLTGVLNLCACGYSTWGSDLGGYFGFPQPAVYMRWFQLGCFSPLMRPHGTAPREPWYYGEAAVTNYKLLAWTRENILNYIYNAAAIAHETGIPIMRSMAVSFPDEQQVAAVPDQYMFGPDLLVAPVIGEDTFRTILFPSGVWTNLWDGKTISGPAKLRVTAPLDTIPVYLKQGAVVPVELSPALRFGESMTSSRVHALAVTPPTGNETVSLLNPQGEVAKVTVQSKDDTVVWTLENLPEMDYLLVYGTTAASAVKVAGKALPKLTATEFGSMAAGWQSDQAGNRLVVRMPPHQIEQSEPTTQIKLDLSEQRLPKRSAYQR